MASPSTSESTLAGNDIASVGHFASPVISTKSYPSNPNSSSAGVSPAVKVSVPPEITPVPPIDKSNESRSASPDCNALISVTVGSGSGKMTLDATLTCALHPPPLTPIQLTWYGCPFTSSAVNTQSFELAKCAPNAATT